MTDRDLQKGSVSQKLLLCLLFRNTKKIQNYTNAKSQNYTDAKTQIQIHKWCAKGECQWKAATVLFCWQSMTVVRPNMDCFVFVAVPPPKLSPRFSLSYCYLLEWRCQNIKNTKILTFLTEDVPLEMSANAHFSAKHTRQRDDGGGHHRQKDLHHHHCHRDVTFSVCSISHGTCHSVGQTQVREREKCRQPAVTNPQITLETNPILLPWQIRSMISAGGTCCLCGGWSATGGRLGSVREEHRGAESTGGPNHSQNVREVAGRENWWKIIKKC